MIRSVLRAIPQAARASSSRLPARQVARYVPAATSFASSSRYYATGPASVSPNDPKLMQAQQLLEDGTRALEDGDMHKARGLYQESLNVMETSGAWFNMGVVQYQLDNRAEAIAAWKSSIALEPSADAYTNLGSAYMMARPPQPAEAIKALTAAMEISPEDPEIQFNLAAVLESTDSLETALQLYRKAHAGGIERAAANIRNIGGKILAKKVQAEGGQA